MSNFHLAWLAVYHRSAAVSSIFMVLLSCYQRIRGFTTMHYINRLFTYLLTYYYTWYLLVTSSLVISLPFIELSLVGLALDLVY